MKKGTPTIAILASGSGSTAEAFIEATRDGVVSAEIGLVICNNTREKAGVYDRVARLNHKHGLAIPVLRISGVTHPGGSGERGEQTLEESEAISEEVTRVGCDLVTLMGYMKKVRGALLEDYGWSSWMRSSTQARLINTHPGPLPETRGLHGIHVQERVLELGMDHSAHTVHVVSGGYDEGRIIDEAIVPVHAEDTAEELFQRVQLVEKSNLPLVIRSALYDRGHYQEHTS